MKTIAVLNSPELIDTFRRNNIQYAAIFGSRAKGTARPDSDYDILVEFSPDAQVGMLKFNAARRQLETVLGNNVDLVTPKGIGKYIRDNVYSSLKVVYDARRKDR